MSETNEKLFEIEKLVEEIKDCEKKEEYLKEYKVKRVSAIDADIKKVKEKTEEIKKQIISIMREVGETKISFPGFCEVMVSKGKIKYDITDEEEFKKFLKEKEKFEELTKKETTYSIIKKETTKYLDSFDESNLPKCVIKQRGDDYTSIKMLEDEEEIKKEVKKVKEEDVSFDKLDF